MSSPKPEPGTPFPPISIPALGGGQLNLPHRESADDWTLIVVYRGKHCPLCTSYLQRLNEFMIPFEEIGVAVVAMSADSEVRAAAQMKDAKPDYPVGYDLSVEQMKALGLYVSSPKLGMDAERPFAEPGLFVVDASGKLKIVDISNVPFARPDIAGIFKGTQFIRSLTGDYPVNGTFV